MLPYKRNLLSTLIFICIVILINLKFECSTTETASLNDTFNIHNQYIFYNNTENWGRNNSQKIVLHITRKVKLT